MNRSILLLCLVLASCATNSPKTSEVQKVSYVNWQPALTPAQVFENTIGFSYTETDEAGNAYWVELRPDDAGRCVLVQLDTHGQLRDLTPKPYSVRTRIFEYGDSPYTVHGGSVYFTSFADQRIYKQSLAHPEQIEPLTPATNADGSLGKYGELTTSPDGRWLAFSYEKEPKSGDHPNYLGLIDLSHGGVQEARVVASGADFYAKPQFSPDGKNMSWLEWNHPFMSWDSTRLMLAPFHEGQVGKMVHIAGSDHSSVGGPTFAANGDLYFLTDFAEQSETSPKNFYNIYRYRQGHIHALTSNKKDYLQLRRSGTELLALSSDEGRLNAVRIDATTGAEKAIAPGYGDTALPWVTTDGRLITQGSPADRPTEMLEIQTNGAIRVLRKSAQFAIDAKDVSRPEPIFFPTSDGKMAYGFYYPPRSSRFHAPDAEKPPVRVLVHGGPVSMTSASFSLGKTFWTSQGYAIFDVNYRGSMGFGRRYRDALKHQWGVLEIQDVKDGLAYLQKQGKISGHAVVSGGSAGGYTVQRLLTSYPDLFAAGASHFGIGNLVTLQKLTHKLESHFLEQLIGGTLETNLAEYEARSPINHLDKLKAPMIIFQGSEDKVVPPENSREMAEILKRKGIPYEYYEYPGEGHGFRKRENLVDALEKESRFFKKVLSSNVAELASGKTL